MGEPLNNFEHVKAAVLGLTDSNLFGMGQKTPFLRCHLDIKCMILPRQARDKHRESTHKKNGVFL
jgi:adenine C2-methylase RlmN of 23S rRNA A2503 and tRNA A37